MRLDKKIYRFFLARHMSLRRMRLKYYISAVERGVIYFFFWWHVRIPQFSASEIRHFDPGTRFRII